MSYKISLLHATRGRPEQAKSCRDAWLNSANNPNVIEHIFGIDGDDTSSCEILSDFNHVVIPPDKGCVAAWNACAIRSNGEILIQLSDDWAPVSGWDDLILKEFEGVDGECVLAINDGARTDDLLCMAILNRKRYNKQGYLFHPDFVSVFSDDYFTFCAKRDDVLKNAKHIVFEHKHPVFGKAQMDSTYQHNNAPAKYAKGHHTFNELTRDKKQTLCLVMIVKNEINNMKRCLESVKDHIDYWVICDTGSTDGTQEYIKSLMSAWNIPGELHERPWVDFAYNRNESLAIARSKADYAVIIDADDYWVIHNNPEVLKNLKQDQYYLRISNGGLTYYRPHIVHNSIAWAYEGVLHEYLAPPPNVRLAPPVMLDNVMVVANASDSRGGYAGSSKYINDALVLEKALLDPKLSEGLKARYTFYQAQSYKDAGVYDRCLKAYEERVKLGGWDEEVYYSMYMIARMKLLLKYSDADIIDAHMQAWEYRPSRLDALYDLIRFLIDKNRYALAYALATIGISIPPTKDTLFIRADLHQWRMLAEYSVVAMRTGNKAKAINAAKTLINSPHFKTLVPAEEQERIKNNLEVFQKAP